MKNILRAVILVAICAGFTSTYAQPGCPAVSTAPSVIIPCGQTCATLNATAFSGAQTTTYTPSVIPYAPPFPYNAGTAVLVATDDLWSGIIPLPFNFCFFGNVYNNIVVGSNGAVSFNTGNAGGYNNWQITGPAPANTQADLFNSICGPWQDLDPTKGGAIHYQVGGTYPCRYFEVSWDTVPMYGDANSVVTSYCTLVDHQTQQIVIYETTNAIEVYIGEKDPICNDKGAGYWNGGLAVEGLINAAGTIAITVPGRNATQWSVTNDAYRFTPSGPANYTISWLANNGTPIGTGPSIQVCPPDTGTYTAVATYTNCDNSTVVVSSAIFVGIGTLHTFIDSVHQPSCNGGTGAVYASFTSSTPVTSFGWSPGGAGQLSLTNIPPGTYIFSATDSTGCTKSDTVTLVNPRPLQVRVADTTITGCNLSTNTGALIAVVAGGTPGYTYNWSNTQHTDTITGLTPGAYTVTVIDSKSCSADGTGNVNITSHSLGITNESTNTLCAGGSDGLIVVTVTGAINPITYNWSGNVSTSDSARNLSAGTYSVTATDSAGCSVSASYTITQPSHINVDSSQIIPVTCSTLGAVFVLDTGGTGVLNYNWSTGASGDTLSNVPTGTYILIVTDQKGCADTSSFTVGLGPGALGFGPTVITPERCNGDSTGAITVSTTGGTGPVKYLWSYQNDSTATITGLKTGTYSVTATDSLGCSASASYVVNQPTPVAVTSDSITNVSCNGGSNGCIVVTAGGGTGNIRYNWSNGDTLATNCGLTAGTYTLTITDSVGCSATASYTVTQPSPIVIDTIITTQATCLAGGSIIVVASGGTGILSYTWSNTLTGDTLLNLAGGPVSVTITDQNGCSLVATDTITAAPGVVVFGTPLITNISCNGDSTGCITATASGGTGTIHYHWNNGDSTATICGLKAGSYSVTITDSVGCSASTTYNVSQPAPVTFNPAIITNVSCNGGNNGCITISATGGTPNYHYHWNTGDSTATICGLSAGPYTVTATDSLGCTGTATYVVGQANPIVFGNPIFTAILCAGDSNGGIIVVATGGTGPIHYRWSAHNDSTAIITGLVAGTYTVTATDSVGCSASAAYTITQPTPVIVDSAVVTQATCQAGGCIILTVSGGTAPYSYLWSNSDTSGTVCSLAGGTYTVTITDAHGCKLVGSYTVVAANGVVTFGPDSITNVLCNGGNTGAITASASGTGPIHFHWSYLNDSTATISGLIAGNYSVTITDSLGCSASTTYTVTQPAKLVIDTVSISPITCQGGGCVVITSTGGTGTVTFQWSNGATGDSLCNLPAGLIRVGALDQNGCTATASINITASGSAIVFGNPVFGNIRCSGDSTGTITITTSGGTGIIHYHWNNGDSTTTITGLVAGTYTVTATDGGGCSASFAYTLNQPQAIIIDGASVTQATCQAGGCIVVTASGGTGQLIYNWSNNATGDSICGLAGGAYTLTITDQNGCRLVHSYTVTAAPGVVSFGADTIKNALCNGGNTGSIHTSANGGTGVIRYHWSYQNDSTAAITGLVAGTYSVTITDSVGCSASTSYVVAQPAAIIIDSVSATQASCQSGACIVITSLNGVGNVTYLWSNSATGDSLCNLSGGPISVTATDQNGCTSSATFIIGSAPGALTFNSPVIDSVACNGGSTGSITISTSGGAGTIRYHWSYQNDSTTTISGLPAGTYSVTATDGDGCSASATYVVNQPSVLAASISYTPQVCFLATDGNATVTATGGTPGYTYKWNNNTTSATDTGLGQGTVTITVTDSKGCTVTSSATINQRTQLNSTVISHDNHCHTPAYGTVEIHTTGGVAPLTFSVPGYANVVVTEVGADTVAHYDSVPQGQYPVTITDSAGCTATNVIFIQSSAADFVTSSSDSATCNGATDGSIIVTPHDLQNGPFGYAINGGAFQTDSIFRNLAAGVYTVVVSNSYGCQSTYSDTVGQPAPGSITPSPDLIDTVLNSVVAIELTTSGIHTPVYSWSPSDGLSCTNCPVPTVTVVGPATYVVTVSDSANKQCAVVDTVIITAKGLFQMPNAFSPNGDGKNDEFGPISFSYATVKAFRIYNRWGQCIHNSTALWDGKFEGKEQPAGTYLYYIEADHYDKYDYSKVITEKMEGTVTLLR